MKIKNFNNPSYYFITTPLFYPNEKLHLGHAYSVIMSDIIARYHRLQGKKVFLLTGSDEHGDKIWNRAQELKQPLTSYIQEMRDNFKDLWKKLQIDYDIFIGTNDVDHQRYLNSVFNKLHENNKLYLDKYCGWYCVSCNEFITNALQKTSNEQIHCPNCQKLSVFIQEETFFWELQDDKQNLINFLNSQSEKFIIFPDHKRKELLNSFLTSSFPNLSVTRTRTFWGIVWDRFPHHFIYVWIDALCGYITGARNLSFNPWKDENCQIIQILGKDILKFHGIYWPLLLQQLHLNLPNYLLVHGWIINRERKMSKSLGNIIDPHFFIDRYGSDATRFCLNIISPIGNDFEMSQDLFDTVYHHYLVNNWGNFISRTLTMIVKYNQSIIPKLETDKLLYSQVFIWPKIVNFFNKINAYMNSYRLFEALKTLMELVTYGNKLIEEIMPWKLFNNQQTQELIAFLACLSQILWISGTFLTPFLPKTSEQLFTICNFSYLPLDKLEWWQAFQESKIDSNDSFIFFQRIKKI
jgi:methionyl-tRNA synthetase